jgi:twitching motility protein PilT
MNDAVSPLASHPEPVALPDPAGDPDGFLNTLVTQAARLGVSDIHLKTGNRPYWRLRGALGPVAGSQAVSAAGLDALAGVLLGERGRKQYAEQRQVDLARGFSGVGRVRASVFQQRGSTSIALRVIPTEIPTADVLGLPAVLSTMRDHRRGMILVTGATGSGKSTTLACIIDQINTAHERHVITIEDPIEYLFHDRRCLISQREVFIDTPDFPRALRAALRQDPDVILIGELRDADTISTAIKASETGHLVLSTLHAPSCPEAVTRLLSYFPPGEQQTVRSQIAANLRAVVSQRLLPRADGTGRVAAFEVMVVTQTVREMIEDPVRQPELREAIKHGAQHGMVDFDEDLYRLAGRGLITRETALEHASNLTDLRLRFEGF